MILVTGGTGFVGEEVVRELLARGYRVRLLVRHSLPSSLKDRLGIEIIRGDVLKPETLPAAMAGVQAVIHLIGIIAETSRVTFEQAHIDATRHVVDAAKQAGVTRYIQMSAEGTRAEAISRYHRTKWEAEELVRRSGLDWTIFRPSLIYGYDERDRLLNLLRRVLSWPLDFFQLYTFPLLDDGRALVQPVSVCEVAHCFAGAVAKEEAIGQTYDLVGPTALSWRAMVTKMAVALGCGVVEKRIALAFVTRILLWLVALLVPIVAVVGLILGRLDFMSAEILVGIGFVLLLIAVRSTRLIIFSIPSGLLQVVSRVWEKVAPRGLRFGEQLKMAVEDNVSDPQPAARTFGYVPESFDQGLARLLSGQAGPFVTKV